jgi:tetratricopeptide (TPR) repeat protein
MAAILARDGQFDIARNCYHVAIEHYSDARDNNGVAYAHDGLADLCRQQGNLDEARRHYDQARQIFLGGQYKPGLAEMLANLAEIAWETGDASEARRLIEESETLARETGAAPIIDHVETAKARVAFEV